MTKPKTRRLPNGAHEVINFVGPHTFTISEDRLKRWVTRRDDVVTNAPVQRSKKAALEYLAQHHRNLVTLDAEAAQAHIAGPGRGGRRKGAGRPYIDGKHDVQARLHDEHLEHVRALADGGSISSGVRAAVERSMVLAKMAIKK